MNSEDAVLTISTEIKREHILIDGDKYLIAAVEDFGIEKYLQIADKSQKASNILTGKYDEASARKAVEYIDELTREILIDVPPAVFDKLNHAHKVAIIKYFAGTVERFGEAPQGKAGKKSSPASKDSTAER